MASTLELIKITSHFPVAEAHKPRVIVGSLISQLSRSNIYDDGSFDRISTVYGGEWSALIGIFQLIRLSIRRVLSRECSLRVLDMKLRSLMKNNLGLVFRKAVGKNL